MRHFNFFRFDFVSKTTVIWKGVQKGYTSLDYAIITLIFQKTKINKFVLGNHFIRQPLYKNRKPCLTPPLALAGFLRRPPPEVRLQHCQTSGSEISGWSIRVRSCSLTLSILSMNALYLLCTQTTQMFRSSVGSKGENLCVFRHGNTSTYHLNDGKKKKTLPLAVYVKRTPRPHNKLISLMFQGLHTGSPPLTPAHNFLQTV